MPNEAHPVLFRFLQFCHPFFTLLGIPLLYLGKRPLTHSPPSASLESNKETIKNYAIVTKRSGGKDKRDSEAEDEADEEDSATAASSYNYYPESPPPPQFADFSSMVTSAQDKIGRSAEPAPGKTLSTLSQSFELLTTQNYIQYAFNQGILTTNSNSSPDIQYSYYKPICLITETDKVKKTFY